MKPKIFVLIFVLNGVFAMESEEKLEYKAEIENLKTICVELVQRELEIDRVELGRFKTPNQIGEELSKLERFCSSCRGAILQGQPHIKTGKNTFFHAICQAGFQGYECSYYPISKAYRSYTQLELAILNVFEQAGKFINLSASYDYIGTRLNRDKIPNPNCLYRICKELSPDLAHWRDNENHWIMHRKHYGKPKDVKWERYIIEILKSRKVLPLVEFSYHPEKGKLNFPPKLLNFIEKYTQCLTFQEALSTHVPKVEIFHRYEVPFIRLKTEMSPEKNFIFPVTQADSTSDACDSKFHHPFESSPASQESSNILHTPTIQFQNYGNRLRYQATSGTYYSSPSKKNNCSVHNAQPEETTNRSSPKAQPEETNNKGLPWKWDEEYQAEF